MAGYDDLGLALGVLALAFWAEAAMAVLGAAAAVLGVAAAWLRYANDPWRRYKAAQGEYEAALLAKEKLYERLNEELARPEPDSVRVSLLGRDLARSNERVQRAARAWDSLRPGG